MVENNNKSNISSRVTTEQRIDYDDNLGLAASLVLTGFNVKGIGLDRGKAYFIFEDNDTIRDAMDNYKYGNAEAPCSTYYRIILELDAKADRAQML
jgi:hypothetical protein